MLPIHEIKNKGNFESNIGWQQNWFYYYQHYRIATNVLIKDIDSSHCSVDLISSALLFLIRHSLELGLKANIQHFKKFLNESEETSFDIGNHKLNELLIKFKKDVNILKVKYQIKDKNESKLINLLSELEKVILELNILDKSSTGFRYPEDLNQNPSFNWNESIDIANLVKAFASVDELLMNVTNMFANYGMISLDQLKE